MLLSIGPLATSLSGALQGAREGEKDRLLNENYYLKNQQDWYDLTQQRDLWQDQTAAKQSEYNANAAQNFLTADSITQNRDNLLLQAKYRAETGVGKAQQDLLAQDALGGARPQAWHDSNARATTQKLLNDNQSAAAESRMNWLKAKSLEQVLTPEEALELAKWKLALEKTSTKTAQLQSESAGNVVPYVEKAAIAGNQVVTQNANNQLLYNQILAKDNSTWTPAEQQFVLRMSGDPRGYGLGTGTETTTAQTGTTTAQTGNQGVALIGSTPFAVTPENSGVLNTLAKNVNNSAQWAKILPGAQVNKDGNLILDGNNMGPALTYYNTQVVPKYNAARTASLEGQGATNTQAASTTPPQVRLFATGLNPDRYALTSEQKEQRGEVERLRDIVEAMPNKDRLELFGVEGGDAILSKIYSTPEYQRALDEVAAKVNRYIGKEAELKRLITNGGKPQHGGDPFYGSVMADRTSPFIPDIFSTDKSIYEANVRFAKNMLMLLEKVKAKPTAPKPKK